MATPEGPTRELTARGSSGESKPPARIANWETLPVDAEETLLAT
jgi:hypothetical protein